MILLAVVMSPVVWWLAAGVQAGGEDKARFDSSPRPHRDVVIYTTMLRALGLFLGLAIVSLGVTGGVIVWKGIRKVRR